MLVCTNHLRCFCEVEALAFSSVHPGVFVSAVVSVASFPAVLTQVEGDSRIFSGEGVRLRCSYSDEWNSTWQYVWFRGEEQLPHRGEDFTLWNAKPKHGGKFYCQGLRETAVGLIRTLQSLPVEIHVDGEQQRSPPPPPLRHHHPGFCYSL